MSIETLVIEKYLHLFPGSRLYWDSTPPGFDTSVGVFCIAQEVGGAADRTYVDNSLSTLQPARVQFSVWGGNRLAVGEASRRLRNAILASNATDFVTYVASGATGDYNEVLQLRGRRQDFGFWYVDALAASP